MKGFTLTIRKVMLDIFGDKVVDREKLEQDIEAERLRKLRIQEQQRLERERLERERQERERRERLRIEFERQERERQERERQERLRLELERQEQENHDRLIYEKYSQIKNDIPPHFKLDSNALAKIHNSDNDQCIICLEDFEIGDRCLYLNCLHLFHAYCIIEWLLKNDKCPICKENYKVDDNKLNAFLKSYTANNNKMAIHKEIPQINNNNNGNTLVINNDVLNLIIQENDHNHNRHYRGNFYQPRHRRGGNYRGRSHARHNRRNNW